MTDIKIGYTTSDYFYTIENTPSQAICDVSYVIIPESTCTNEQSWIDNSYNCYTAALCKNQKYAKTIQQQQTQHLGTNQNFDNTKLFVTNEQWKSIHLGLGIVAIIGGIYFFNNNTQSV
jgi:hypothetical protein